MNRSFADVSMNYYSDEFEVVDLMPITKSASSFFGITGIADKRSAIYDRGSFNSGNPISYGSLTAITGGIASAVFGYNFPSYWYNENARIITGAVSTMIWLIINDVSWSHSIRNKAIQRCNYALQANYSRFDTFINPKYEVTYHKSLFGTTCEVTLIAQGVRFINKDD